MTISNLKDLEKLIKLCRKNGVHAITVDGIHMSISAPIKASNRPAIEQEMFPEENMPVPTYTPTDEPLAADSIETDELTQEQLLFYSSATTETSEVQ